MITHASHNHASVRPRSRNPSAATPVLIARTSAVAALTASTGPSATRWTSDPRLHRHTSRTQTAMATQATPAFSIPLSVVARPGSHAYARNGNGQLSQWLGKKFGASARITCASANGIHARRPTVAITYAAPTRMRSNLPTKRPPGNASTRCASTAPHSQAPWTPTLTASRPPSDQRRDPSSQVKPTATMMIPTRLPGCRRRASKPVAMNAQAPSTETNVSSTRRPRVS